MNLKKEMKDLFYMHIKNVFLKIFLEIELLELFTIRCKRHFIMEHTLFFLSGKPLSLQRSRLKEETRKKVI